MVAVHTLRIARVRTLDRRLVERTGSNRLPSVGTKRAATVHMYQNCRMSKQGSEYS